MSATPNCPEASKNAVHARRPAVESKPHICVCICTFRRPEMLGRLLRALRDQRTDQHFTWSIVVADNDAGASARTAVDAFASSAGVIVDYVVEPRQNIALARNLALSRARGEFIAFIDDDEFPSADWLLKLWETCVAHQAAGVLGPVLPHFDAPPPAWIVRGRFCERPSHPTGHQLHWSQCRTGNLLFRASILPAEQPPFAVEFGNGGEDMDFFQRMTAAGHRFVWCQEAEAHETVPPNRWSRRYWIRRALLRGKNILKHRHLRTRLLLTSAAAVPAYLVILPFTVLGGHHCFMRHVISLSDHVGRLLAVVGFNPVHERDS